MQNCSSVFKCVFLVRRCVVNPLAGRYATQVNLGVQSFRISPAIRLVLSANELFYPQIRG
ncbi:hypothetical protein CCZ37_17070 [Vibrio qinghaiensis]|uniref:DUF3265 domain-containing protein n=1 Tax=Vibrio qinghaiensis TaxID=2025808 RepID=A0A223N357_9VIBR|nr:hypothetical protein CCZ37_17070 [Vibrio qinghaiensis]